MNTDLPKTNRYRVEAVDRALVLLDTLATMPGATGSELATALGANNSLVFRLLSTLSDRGFVARDDRGTYRLGPRLQYLGQQADSSTALVDASRDMLDLLLERTQENIYLVVRDRLDALCISARVSPQTLRLNPTTGDKRPLYTGTLPKVLLAYAPADIVEDVIRLHLDKFNPPKLRVRKNLEKLLEKIRKDGFYESIDETDPDVYSLSAPVRDHDGKVVALLAIGAPSSRISEKKRAEFRKLVLDCAVTVTGRLGHRTTPDRPKPSSRESEL